MHRAVLQALIPAFVALAIAFVLLRLVIRISGGKLSLGRLRRLHRCQHGGVQTLSFVLTLPLFVMLVMFIMQVSQLMIGIMVVHHAAFAAGRAAIVWTPAHFGGASGYNEELENLLPHPIADDHPILMQFRDNRLTADQQDQNGSYKLNKIFGAAVLAVAPAAPGRALVQPVSCPQCGVQPSLVQEFYRQWVPASANNPKIAERLRNKLSYAYWNTTVDLSFLPKDVERGPTYNPRAVVFIDGEAVADGSGGWLRSWNRNEVGWQDPIVVRVTHDFALLPGPGRFLARFVVGGDGRRDEVAPRIRRQTGSSGIPVIEPVYTTPISASVTFTNEGFKPLLSYVQNTN